MKFIRKWLFCSTFFVCMAPMPAHAGVLETLLIALTATIQGGLVSVGIGGAFLGVIGGAIYYGGLALGSLTLNFGLNALVNKQRQPPPQETQSNFIQGEADRRWCMGHTREGGNVQFAEVKDGKLYKLINHCDAQSFGPQQYWLNDFPVQIDGTGQVTTDSFEGYEYYKIFGRNGAPDQSASAVLMAAFPEWTANHKGAGITDTLLVITIPPNDKRAKTLKYRGVLGLGEPDITRGSIKGKHYDPRNDSTQPFGDGPERVDDKSTWSICYGNPILIAAAHRLDPERFGNDPDDINWQMVAEGADVCDETLTDRYGNSIPRYRAGISLNKRTQNNIDGENEILATCDAIRVTDELGRIGFIAGKYEASPSLILRDEDFFEIESSESDNGESGATHRFLSYTEPEFQWRGTQSAEFASPDYEITDQIKTQDVQIYGVQHHNQCQRLLKSMMHRESEKHQISAIVGLAGIRAKKKRFLSVISDLDPTMSGVYEIAPTKDPYDGLRGFIGLVKCANDRWNLLPGEEGERPNFDIDVTVDGDLDNILPGNMAIQAERVSIENETITATRLSAVFTTPSRQDISVVIEHRKVGAIVWEEFNVRTSDGAGASGIVSSGPNQQCRWRTETFGGQASEWSSTITVSTIADITPPANLSGVSVTGGINQAEADWTAPNSVNYGSTRIYRGVTNVFSAASLVRTEPGFPNASDTWLDTGLAVGTYYYWLEPVNRSGIAGTRVGPITVTVI